MRKWKERGGECERRWEGGVLVGRTMYEWGAEEITKAKVDSDIDKVKGCLHGRMRKELRRRINEAVNKREDLAERGKLKKVLDSLLERGAEVLNWDRLETGNDVVLGQREVHDSYTEHMDRWHGGGEEPTDEAYWEGVFGTYEQFQDVVDKRIPEWIGRTVWDAVRNEKKADKKARVNATLMEYLDPAHPPSFEEFYQRIRVSARGGKGAGPSGVTYRMLKELSEESMMRLYDRLCEVWRTLKYPDGWGWRWMVLLPKVVGHTMDEVRPISLVEVIRKCWNSLILKRIGQCLEKEGILEDGQHAYRLGRGTDSAVIQVLNVLEEAEELATEVYVSSWDTKRAFDTPDKEVLIRSWTRLGVPKNIAEYLISMDREGKTVLKSNIAQRTMEGEGMGGFGGEGLGVFKARRGTGQGDVVSPLNWDAFYDIILGALRRTEGEEFSFRVADQELVKMRDLAYSDDLLSVVSTMTALQRKADVVSGFMAIFKMKISVGKLRAFTFSFRGREGVVKEQEDLIIHNGNWDPEVVKVKCSGCLKYLGIHMDTENRGEVQLDMTKTTLGKQLRMVEAKMARSNTKRRVIESSVIPKLVYVAKFASWRKKDMGGLERRICQTYRRLTKNMRSFPKDLILMGAAHGGLGMAGIDDRICGEQWAMLRRTPMGGEGAGAAAQALIERSIRGGGNSSIRGLRVNMTPRKDGPWLVDRVIERMGEVGYSLMRGGEDRPAELECAVKADMRIGLQLAQDHQHAQEWAQGQVWWEEGGATELLGKDGEEWEVRRWERTQGKIGGPRRGEQLKQSVDTPCRGAGSGVKKTMGGHAATRVFLGPDYPVGGVLHADVKRAKTVRIWKHQRQKKTQWYGGGLEQINNMRRPVVFSDGSFRERKSCSGRPFLVEIAFGKK